MLRNISTYFRNLVSEIIMDNNFKNKYLCQLNNLKGTKCRFAET